MRAPLRVIDDGTSSALRSQALWHGLASAMTEGDDPVLSFCRPAEPYVGLGYFTPLEDIDFALCRRRGLPVIRRQIGGGPVYLDEDQHFFQITLPARAAPARIDRLYERLLEPAAEAFRALGLPVRRRGLNDLSIADRKISGTGAGRLGDGVVVVGNLLLDFPHRRMVEILALPSEATRQRVLELMRRHVTSVRSEGVPAPAASEIQAALVEAYARRLQLEPRRDGLTDREQLEVARWQARFDDPEWLIGPAGTSRATRRVKVSEGVWWLSAAEDLLEVEVTIVAGRIASARALNDGRTLDIERGLRGCLAEIAALRDPLRPLGEAGSSILQLLGPELNALAQGGYGERMQ